MPDDQTPGGVRWPEAPLFPAKTRTDRAGPMAVAAWACLLAGVVLAGFLGFLLWPLLLLPFGAALACGGIAWRDGRRTGRSRPGIAGAVAAGLALLAMGWIIFRFLSLGLTGPEYRELLEEAFDPPRPAILSPGSGADLLPPAPGSR